MKFNDKQFSVYNGNKLRVKIFGASHSKHIGVDVKVLDEITFDEVKLEEFMARRRAKKTAYSTKRIEQDKILFKKGVLCGQIKGEFKAIIQNNAKRSSDYLKTLKKPRPSHADFVAWSKYGDGFDYRGGGKFSGRLTAPMCIVGGILKQHLEEKGIKINAFISQIGKVKGKSYKDLPADIKELSFSDQNFRLLDDSVREKMEEQIQSVAKRLDSVGGVIDCVITGVPVGAGEYMFDSIESVISQLAFAVPAVKGIEFGSGFDLSSMRGSKANDEFYLDNGVVKTYTNNNGGINGGLANGMPITFRVAIKPTPSIGLKQRTVDLTEKENTEIKIEGRHDACIVPRAVPVIEAISAMAIFDLI